MKKDGNGICMFAYNNEHLDYVKFATLAAKYVKKNMMADLLGFAAISIVILVTLILAMRSPSISKILNPRY